MATGNELVLGYKATENWLQLGIQTAAPVSATFLEHEVMNMNARYKSQLHGAQILAFKKAGFTNPISLNLDDGFISADTQKGHRRFKKWGFCLYFDSAEGDGLYDKDIATAIIGVNISGRYHPVFADWQDKNGGMSMIFDSGLQEMQKIARDYLIDATYPLLNNAYWIVQEVFY